MKPSTEKMAKPAYTLVQLLRTVSAMQLLYNAVQKPPSDKNAITVLSTACGWLFVVLGIVHGRMAHQLDQAYMAAMPSVTSYLTKNVVLVLILNVN